MVPSTTTTTTTEAVPTTRVQATRTAAPTITAPPATTTTGVGTSNGPLYVRSANGGISRLDGRDRPSTSGVATRSKKRFSYPEGQGLF